METTTAFALKEAFLKQPFIHAHTLEKETIYGAHTGDMVCSICGLDSNEIEYSKEWDGLAKVSE